MKPSTEISGLEKHLQSLARAQGSKSKVYVGEIKGASSLSAHIDLTNQDIRLQIPDDWNPEQYEQIKAFVDHLKIRDPKRKVCEDITFHEVGHDRLKNDVKGLGCPEDVEGKELAVEAVTKALLEEGKYSPSGVLYLENLISDDINNLNGSQYTHFNGLSIFLAEQGELNQGEYSPLYEAFVKLNLFFWGRKPQRKLLKEYYLKDQEKQGTVDEAVSSIIKELDLNQDKKHNLAILFNKEKWSEIYYTFAKHLAQFMDTNSPESLPGDGNGGKGYHVPDEFDDHPSMDPKKVKDPLMRKVLDPDNLKRMMRRRNQGGKSVPNFIENWRALDYFYQSEAGEIYIKAESPQKGFSLPVAPIQARRFDPERDDLERIMFNRILFDERGRPCLAVPKSYLDYTSPVKQTLHSYPTLNIALLDTSISMRWNSQNEHDEKGNGINVGKTNIIPWGDESKYHYALLTDYGVDKCLHRIGVATRMRKNLIVFNSQTEATGEKGYDDRDEIKRRMLNPEFGNSTSIDVEVLARQAREKGSVLMTISDGNIQNWSSIKDRFKQIISDKFYVHFQIGSDTQTTRDLESWGAAVVKINDAKDLPKKAIDITRKFYQSYQVEERR